MGAVSQGFCLFNSAALAAKYAVQGTHVRDGTFHPAVRRVAVGRLVAR